MAGATLMRSDPARARAGARVAAGEALELLCVAAIAVPAIALVVAAAQHASLLVPPSRAGYPGWLAGPLHGLGFAVTSDGAVLHRYGTIVILVMTAGWLVLLATRPRPRPATVAGAVVLLHAVFLLSPPLALTDIFNYLAYARLDVVHGLNPYISPPAAAPHDAAYGFSTWHGLRSPYGPLFTAATLPLAQLPLATAYWVYKATVTAAGLGSVGLLWAIAQRLGRNPARAVAIVGLCPLYLVYELGGQHNDVFVVLALLGGVWLSLTGRELLAGVAMAAAVGLKAYAIVLAVPLLLGAARRARAFAGAVGGGAVVAALTFALFGAHGPDLGEQGRLVSALSVPNVAGLIVGRGGADAALRSAATAALVVAAGAAALVAWRRRRHAVEAAAWAGLASVVALSWVMPWYVVWALPFAALAVPTRARAGAVVVALYLTLATLPLASTELHHLGVHTSRSAVGQANRRLERALLLGRPPGAAPTRQPASRRGPS